MFEFEKRKKKPGALFQTHPLLGLPTAAYAQLVSMRGGWALGRKRLPALRLGCTTRNQPVVFCNQHETFQRIRCHECCQSAAVDSLQVSRNLITFSVFSLDGWSFIFQCWRLLWEILSFPRYFAGPKRKQNLRSSLHLVWAHFWSQIWIWDVTS